MDNVTSTNNTQTNSSTSEKKDVPETVTTRSGDEGVALDFPKAHRPNS